jgi:hypothetical protein
MKQTIDLTKEPLTDKERQLILIWKKRKHYTEEPTLSLGEVIEYLIGISYTFHHDFGDGRFFNNILINNESVIAWDGEPDELIDVLFYEVRAMLHKAFSRTLIIS